MLLNTLQWTGRPPQQRMILPKMSTALRCWNSGLDIGFEARTQMQLLLVLSSSAQNPSAFHFPDSYKEIRDGAGLCLSHGIWSILSPEFLFNPIRVLHHSLKTVALITFWSQDPFKLLQIIEGSKCLMWVLCCSLPNFKAEKVLKHKHTFLSA